MNKYSGSNFDDFLKEKGIFDEVSALTKKRLAALRAGEIVEVDDTSELPEDSTKPIDRFIQWFQQTVRSLFPSPFAVSTAGFGVLVLIIGGFYLGNHYFNQGLSGGSTGDKTQLSKLVPVSSEPVEPTLVKRTSKDAKVSSFGFGAFLKIPTNFPDQNIWNVIQKRSSHDPNGAKTLELLARVRIELWNQGKYTKGVVMHPSSGMIYPDSSVEILSASAEGETLEVSRYGVYFDEGLVPSGRIFVKFLEGGIDPYKFLNLPR
jgi:hypothetical protein